MCNEEHCIDLCDIKLAHSKWLLFNRVGYLLWFGFMYWELYRYASYIVEIGIDSNSVNDVGKVALWILLLNKHVWDFYAKFKHQV